MVEGTSAVLEVGGAGTSGVAEGVTPVVRDGAVVATIGRSRRRGPVPAVVAGQEWSYEHQRRQLLGRWASDPQGTARCWARQASPRSDFDIELEGTPVTRRLVDLRALQYVGPDGVAVAEVRVTGVIRETSTMIADPRLPLHHQVFLLWLDVLVRGEFI
jgi:hypothetical protein